MAIQVNDVVIKLSGEPGLWRVLRIESDRRYEPGDYVPLGRQLGDPAPARAVLERVCGWDFTALPCERQGQRPRRAGASLEGLRRVDRAFLEGVARRAMELARMLPDGGADGDQEIRAWGGRGPG